MNHYSDKRYFIRFGELPEDGISHSWNKEQNTVCLCTMQRM